jgi:TrkA domain protein
MRDVTETPLPGVGVRFEFTSGAGERVGVLVHRGGRRELMVYDAADPDRCSTLLRLDADDTYTLNELLGGSRVSEVTLAVSNTIQGLAIDWLTIPSTSAMAGHSIGEGKIRTQTGVSIVAILRGDATIPAPSPEEVLAAGDVLVSVGTPPGIEQARAILES